MNEKIIIKSTLGSLNKKLFFLFNAIGVVNFFILWNIPFVNVTIQQCIEAAIKHNQWGQLICAVIPGLMGFTIFPAFIFATIIHLLLISYNITITDKHIYGARSFNRKVNLPLQLVVSVNECMFDGIIINLGTTKLRFYNIANRDQIQEILSQMLLKKNDNTQVQHNNISNQSIDDLIKLKDLFDQGIITQEEFDAKKKQLLGL